MNYFVSIGDCYYHDWQIQSLIKSFDKIGLLNKLYISISSDKKFNKFDSKKINFFVFPNKGGAKGYYKYNKWYCLYDLLKNNTIKPPLTLLEPHTLIHKDTEEIANANKADIIYQFEKKFVFDKKYYKKEAFNFKENYLFEYWMNFGDTIIFKNIDPNIFLNILNKIEILSIYLEDYTNLDKLAVIGSILESNKILKIESKTDIEADLYQNNINYILNYKHGFKHIFQKKYYKDNINFCGKTIQKNLSDIRYTKCLDFFYNILNYDFDA